MIKQKYNVGDTVFVLQGLGILKANINAVQIRIEKQVTNITYRLHRMSHGSQTDGYYESDVFASPQELIKNLGERLIVDETTYVNGGTLPGSMKMQELT